MRFLRVSILIVVFILAVSMNLSAALETLPAYCGGVGAEAYQHSTEISIPYVVLEIGTVITVTTTSDAIDGDVSSVKALLAIPGTEGISLREVLTATNNEPGV